MKKVIIALVILAAALGVYYWNQSGEVVEPTQSGYRDEATGVSFDYDEENYVLLEQAPNDSTPTLIKTIVLMQKADYQSILNGEREGGEGPAAITLQVYNNPSNLAPRAWVEANPGLSNSPLIMGGIEERNVARRPGLTYGADGLYASRNAVFASEGKIYLASGQYMDRESDLYREFDDFLESIEIK